jgi:hypothetical protein
METGGLDKVFVGDVFQVNDVPEPFAGRWFLVTGKTEERAILKMLPLSYRPHSDLKPHLD